MCIGVPGKVVKVSNNLVIVLGPYGEKECESTINLIKGDFVLTFNGLVIRKLTENEASSIMEAFNNTD